MHTIVWGMGRMGQGVAVRLAQAGLLHGVINRTPEVAEQVAATLAVQAWRGAEHLLEHRQPGSYTVWLYLPAGEATEYIFQQLLANLQPGDTIIDGGNAFYRDSIRRIQAARERGIAMLDVGTSGGVAGKTEGYCLMIGGDEVVVAAHHSQFQAIACESGWARVGNAGAGHFTKMVHNGIEYGMMQAYAEGLELLREAPENGLSLELKAATEVWQHGSIIRSYLGQLVAQAVSSPGLIESASSVVAQTGEGAWMQKIAQESGLPTPVLDASIAARIGSANQERWGNRMLSTLRALFGGHSLS